MPPWSETLVAMTDPLRQPAPEDAYPGDDDAVGYDDAFDADPGYDGEQADLADRQALRRVAGLSTELQDVTEVEYRQLRLERVVLVGVWTEGTAQDAENSLRELAALAETAGSQVLDGLIQRRAQAGRRRPTSARARPTSCATWWWRPAPTP